MKKIIAILLVMVMLVMLVFGCVSRESYDVLMADYDGLRVRVESAESNLAAAQGQVQTLQSDLSAEQSKSAKLESDFAAEQSKSEKLESDLTDEQNKTQKLESDLSAAQSEAKKLEGDYDTLKHKIDRAGPYGALLEKFYFVEAYEMTTSEIIELTAMVALLGDDEVQEKFEAWMEATTERKALERSGEFWMDVWDGLWEALYPGGAES